MFKKVLIANRGEIAVRIIRTCQRLGIQTVAIYSEADEMALHVKMADFAYPLGGVRVKESSLQIEKIVDIAVLSQVEAIHPGYGLLSEHALFAKRCLDRGIAFIGPSPMVIAQMGSKVEARRSMEKAGVPVVPGITYPLTSVVEAIEAAKDIGFPVMLKASAGGGGIGIQVANSETELEKAFAGNQKRAHDYFGDGAMYLEKYIQNPRHIEVQVLADSNGNTVHLWERECSIQRRHQKIVEEAPSLFLDEITRSRMGQMAVHVAKSIGYENAGTVEFLVDEDKNFYFLEMNTRLQVEHPVTEEITGLDLVEEQLRIAAGQLLGYEQNDVLRQGHSIEVRVYAEDPKTFFPSPGVITDCAFPDGEGVRHELAVEKGSLVTPYYDPMIAKLIVHGDDRNQAIQRLRQALSNYQIEGIKTNLPLLSEIVAHPAFQTGDTTTNFIHKFIQV